MAFVFQARTRGRHTSQPAELDAAVPNRRSGDTIHLDRKTLRVLEVRDYDADQPPALVVEEDAG